MHAGLSNLLCVVSCLLFTYAGSSCAIAAGAKYSNAEYGFSVLRPEIGSWIESQPPAPNHGVAVDLPSGGRIWVDGSYDASFQGSARAVLNQLLEEANGKVTRSLRQGKVANLEAASASYTKGENISTRTVAYRPRAHAVAIVYTLGLDTIRTRQEEDYKVFEKIVRSFSILPLPQ